MCHALLAHSVALLLAQQLQGTTVCPTPDDVRNHLRALVRDEGDAGAIGRLVDEPAGVRLMLDDAAGRRLGERLLPPSSDCRALAAAAAVSLAVWQGRIDARGSEPVRASLANWAVGAGGSLSTAPAGGDLGGALGLAVLARVRGSGMLAGQLLLERQAERTFALGAGEVRSRRTSAGLGVEIGQRAGPFRLAAQALVLGARLSLRGSGYGSDRADQAWDVGLGARCAAPGRIADLRLDGHRGAVLAPPASGGGRAGGRDAGSARARGGARGGHRIRAALTRFFLSGSPCCGN